MHGDVHAALHRLEHGPAALARVLDIAFELPSRGSLGRRLRQLQQPRAHRRCPGSTVADDCSRSIVVFARGFSSSKPSAYACIMPYSMPLWTIFTKWPAPDWPDVRVAAGGASVFSIGSTCSKVRLRRRRPSGSSPPSGPRCRRRCRRRGNRSPGVEFLGTPNGSPCSSCCRRRSRCRWRFNRRPRRGWSTRLCLPTGPSARRARSRQCRNHVLQRRDVRDRWIRVVADDLVAIPPKALRDAGAHAPQSDDAYSSSCRLPWLRFRRANAVSAASDVRATRRPCAFECRHVTRAPAPG